MNSMQLLVTQHAAMKRNYIAEFHLKVRAIVMAQIENTMAMTSNAVVARPLYRIGGITEAMIDCVVVLSVLMIVYARLRVRGAMPMKRM